MSVVIGCRENTFDACRFYDYQLKTVLKAAYVIYDCQCCDIRTKILSVNKCAYDNNVI